MVIAKRYKYYEASQKPDGIPDDLFAEFRDHNPRRAVPKDWEIVDNPDYVRFDNQKKIDEWREQFGPKTEDEIALIKIKAARDFGLELIDEFAVFNVKRQLNSAQVMQVAGQLSGVMGLLQTGSLYAALSAMSAINTNALIDEATILSFGNKIRLFLRRDQVSSINDLPIVDR